MTNYLGFANSNTTSADFIVKDPTSTGTSTILYTGGSNKRKLDLSYLETDASGGGSLQVNKKLKVTNDIVPDTDNTHTIGSGSLHFVNVFAAGTDMASIAAAAGGGSAAITALQAKTANITASGANTTVSPSGTLNTGALVATGDVTSSATTLNTLKSTVNTNTSNIATNTSNIATNTSNIATNTSNITTNTSNITSNSSAITTLQGKTVNITASGANTTVSSSGTLNTGALVATGDVTSSATTLNTVNSGLTSNTSAITTLQNKTANITASGANTTISSSGTLNTGALVSTGDVTSSLYTVNTLGGTVGTNTTKLANISASGLNTTVSSSGTLNTGALVATGDVTSSTTTLNTLKGTVTTNTSNIATNTSSIATNTTSITSNSSAITTLQNKTSAIDYGGVTTIGVNTSAPSNIWMGAANVNTSRTTGAANVGIGNNSLSTLTSASGNIAVGNASGNTVTTGDSNTLIGLAADVTSGSITNSTGIGNGVQVRNSNEFVAGNDSVTVWRPNKNNTASLGTSTFKYKDGVFAGNISTSAGDVSTASYTLNTLGANVLPIAAPPTVTVTSMVASTSAFLTPYNTTNVTNTGVQYQIFSDAGTTTLVNDSGLLSAGATYDIVTNYPGGTHGTTYYIKARHQATYNGTAQFGAYSTSATSFTYVITYYATAIYANATGSSATPTAADASGAATSWYLGNGRLWTQAQRIAVSKGQAASLGSQTLTDSSSYTFTSVDGFATSGTSPYYTLLFDFGSSIAFTNANFVYRTLFPTTPGGWDPRYANGSLIEYWNGSTWSTVYTFGGSQFSATPVSIVNAAFTNTSFTARYFRVNIGTGAPSNYATSSEFYITA